MRLTTQLRLNSHRIAAVAGGGGSFDPLSLFAAGEQGFWLDPSDAATLAVLFDQPLVNGAVISDMADKSGRGNSFIANIMNGPSYTGGAKPYLTFDGVNDGLGTDGSITPTSGFVQVFAAVMKNSDAAVGTVVEWGASTASGTSCFHLKAPRGGSAPGYAFRSKGTVTADAAVDAGYGTGVGRVITGLGSLATPYSKLRINGTEVANVTTAQTGTPNYNGPSTCYVGSRGHSSEFFNGRLYGLLVRFGPALTAQQISDMETWLASKM